ncbi:MAG: LysM peptidoglycan-binding domain-containing protein [Bacteroidia bacterium]
MKTIILSLIFTFISFSNPHLEAKRVLGLMHQNLNGIKAHSYRLNLAERRIDNQYHQGELLISVQNQPLKIRAEVLGPAEGPLVEYDAAADKTNAVITPRKWLPAVKFKQDVNSKMVRRGHYSIHETTFNHFDFLIQKMEARLLQNGDSHHGIKYHGITSEEGVSCHKIELIDAQYQIQNYQINREENLIDLAQNKWIHPYKILELNPQLSSYDEIRTGQRIKIPTSYAKRCVLYIDTQDYLPRRLEVYDELGWFEKYSFRDISIRR